MRVFFYDLARRAASSGQIARAYGYADRNITDSKTFVNTLDVLTHPEVLVPSQAKNAARILNRFRCKNGASVHTVASFLAYKAVMISALKKADSMAAREAALNVASVNAQAPDTDRIFLNNCFNQMIADGILAEVDAHHGVRWAFWSAFSSVFTVFCFFHCLGKP